MTDRILHTIGVGDEPRGDVLVLPVSCTDFDALKLNGSPALPDGARERLLGAAARSRFEAKPGSTLDVLLDDSRLLTLIGLGGKAGTAELRDAAAAAAERVPAEMTWSLVVPALPERADAEALRAATEGVGLAGYRFKNSAKPGPVPAGACTLVAACSERESVVQRALGVTEGMLLTRDLINTPACDLGPEELAAAARAAGERGGWSVETWAGEELRERGFGLTYGCGQAASRPSTVTVIDATGGRTPALGFVGKGVVFDTGGLDIKTSGFMQLMRKDKGGACTVIGAIDALARIGCELPFLAVIPSAENSVGPLSMRPGDVLRAYDGQTVEIGNTDAEGRLLLGDGLAYARERGAARLLDVATLTGAARVALGPDVPALFGNDEELVELLLEKSRDQDEMLWRMPLVDAYDTQIDSPFADMNNSGSDRRGGAITAALFLRRFAGTTPFAHIDLYAWEDRGRPGTPKGANGMAVRTLVEALQKLASSAS